MSSVTHLGTEAALLSGAAGRASESARDARNSPPVPKTKSEVAAGMPRGEPRFVDEAELPDLFRDAERAGLLPVPVPAARACDRGKLALVLEEAVEVALERRGACPPGVGAASDLDASLSDQLYRARLIELRGLCLAVGPLEAIATLSGALDAEDSAVLRFWMEATHKRPLELALDTRNRSIAVYGPPVALADVVCGRTAEAVELPPSVSPEIAASSATMELSEPPPAVALNSVPTELAPSSNQPSLAGDLAQALVAELTATTEEPRTSVERAHDVPAIVIEAVLAEVAESSPAQAPESSPETPSETADVIIASEASDTPETPSVELPNERAEVVPESVERVVLVEAQQEATAVEEAPSTERRPPLHPDAASEWRNWLAEIERARGPKPLGAVERMFVSAYVPLRDAYLRGIAPPEVGAVLEGWAASFAKSYTDAFDALRVRGKRPTMVLDVPDTAHRIGRLHGARSVQLLLVDGMRYDLGLRVEQLLRERLGREAALTERLLLWSALPSDSATQLELIGRGADGLRDFGGPPDSEVPVARGRMATTPRRIKAGHRELLKLDVVEARLSEPGPREAERLDALAGEVAEAIAELCEKLPARTLLMVFGDHGFLLDPQGSGTGAARQGGARPEQVLVPAFAWLVGGVQ
jgi:hypothetical protein